MGHDLSSSSSDDDDDDDDCDEEIVESFSRLPSISSSSFQGRHSLYNFAIENEGIMRGMSAMKEGGGGTAAFDVDLSTQENYRAEGNELYGEFREIRAGLDREYHGELCFARPGRGWGLVWGGGGGVGTVLPIFTLGGTT